MVQSKNLLVLYKKFWPVIQSLFFSRDVWSPSNALFPSINNSAGINPVAEIAFSQYMNATNYLSPQSSHHNSSSTSPLLSNNQNSNSKSQAASSKFSKENSAAEEDEEEAENENEKCGEKKLSILISKPFGSPGSSDVTANSEVSANTSLIECAEIKQDSKSPSLPLENLSASSITRECDTPRTSSQANASSSTATVTC